MSLSSIVTQQVGSFDPNCGLPDELFDYIRELVPLIGVELIIHDEEKGFLLSYRHDEFYTGWHFIGGLLRYRESWSQRIRITAIDEIGTEVKHTTNPFHVVENTSKKIDPRAHSINLLFHCTPVDKKTIKTITSKHLEPIDKQLSWFKELPLNMLDMHRDYLSYWHTAKKLN